MTASTSHLIAPHGGELANLFTQPERNAELKAHSREWPSWDLTQRQICDLELLMTGGFSPLHGFMTKAEYEAQVETPVETPAANRPEPAPVTMTKEEAVNAAMEAVAAE